MSKVMLVDFAILLGCDFCPKIRNIGPVTAYDLIRKYKNMAAILRNLDQNKYIVPEDFFESYTEAKKMFLNPDVIPGASLDLTWNKPDETGLIRFLSQRTTLSRSEIEAGIRQLTVPHLPKKKKTKPRKKVNSLTLKDIIQEAVQKS